MFRRRNPNESTQPIPAAVERVTSVIGEGIALKGRLSGSGGVRIEGAFDGDVHLRGLLVVGETGRLTGKQIKANMVIIAGLVQSDILAEKVEIRSTGRVWGDVVTAAFATEEGAFLRGQIRMEEQVDLGSPPIPEPLDIQIEAPEPEDETPAEIEPESK